MVVVLVFSTSTLLRAMLLSESKTSIWSLRLNYILRGKFVDNIYERPKMHTNTSSLFFFTVRFGFMVNSKMPPQTIYYYIILKELV